MTLDTNIEYSHKNIYNKYNLDILEIKLPIDNSDSENNKYLKEINDIAGTNLHFERFSDDGVIQTAHVTIIQTRSIIDSAIVFQKFLFS
jgi:hypothetical protein